MNTDDDTHHHPHRLHHVRQHESSKDDDRPGAAENAGRANNNGNGRSNPVLMTRIVSGSLGAIVTSLAVTPLEVVKVRQQAMMGPSLSPVVATTTTGAATSAARRAVTSAAALTTTRTRCIECGNTFLLYNGLMDCVLPKSCVPYWRQQQQQNNKTSSSSGSAVGTTGSKGGGGRRAVGAAARVSTGDMAKKMIQAVPSSSSSSSSSSSVDRGTFSMLRHIFRTEGVGGLYAGLSPTLVMSVPSTVLYFTAYDEFASRLKREWTSLRGNKTIIANQIHHDEQDRFNSVAVPLIAGSTARLMTTVIISPLELIRTRQAHSGGTSTILEELATLTSSSSSSSSNGGVRNQLFRGLGPTLWRDVPFSAVYWLGVESIRTYLRKDYERRHGITAGGGEETLTMGPGVTAWHNFVSGAIAGMMAACVTTPFDVVKTRMQLEVMAATAVEVEAPVVATAAAATTAATTAQMTAAGGGGGSACAIVMTCNGHNGGASTPSLTTGVVAGSSSSTLTRMKQIAQTEGWKGLWRGNVTRMIKVAPACAIMISCYEVGKNVLS